MIWMFLSGVLSGVLFGASYVWSICAESSGAAETDDDVRLAYELGFKWGLAEGYAHHGGTAHHEARMHPHVSSNQLN